MSRPKPAPVIAKGLWVESIALVEVHVFYLWPVQQALLNRPTDLELAQDALWRLAPEPKRDEYGRLPDRLGKPLRSLLARALCGERVDRARTTYHHELDREVYDEPPRTQKGACGRWCNACRKRARLGPVKAIVLNWEDAVRSINGARPVPPSILTIGLDR